MPDTHQGRVAVYLDFDNIVLSWYDRVHGRNSFARDRQRITEDPTATDIAERLRAAVIDVGAIIDYASSFGTLVLTRAYADWSAPMNAEYRTQLVARAVDLVQLFPAAAYAKNGADIRLAVDAVEDMFRLEDLTHVVIVGGDSDYVPLAQRCKRLGRYVVGVGVAGSTAKSLTAACDEFASYDALPGLATRQLPVQRTRAAKAEKAQAPASQTEQTTTEVDGGTVSDTAVTVTTKQAGSRSGSGKQRRSGATAGEVRQAQEHAQDPAREAEQETHSVAQQETRSNAGPEQVSESKTQGSGKSRRGSSPVNDELTDEEDADFAVTGLLIRALWLSQDKDDSGWLYSSAVKQQMRRMDPSFNEKALGFRSFSDFLKSRSDVAELEETGHERLVRLRDQGA